MGRPPVSVKQVTASVRAAEVTAAVTFQIGKDGRRKMSKVLFYYQCQNYHHKPGFFYWNTYMKAQLCAVVP